MLLLRLHSSRGSQGIESWAHSCCAALCLPAGRVGVPADVAELCLFLADGARSGFITGQRFVVDGGVTTRMVYPE